MELDAMRKRSRIAMLASAGLAMVPTVYAAHVGSWILSALWLGAVAWCVHSALRA